MKDKILDLLFVLRLIVLFIPIVIIGLIWAYLISRAEKNKNNDKQKGI